ncbi:MAG: MEKHLA domain-containing protein [Nostocales cyanobacterium 94392]|nr:MEKHLA domain-containing protein [Nostocales cyanobacterium 94392]
MTINNIQFPWQKNTIVHHTQVLISSFERWTGRTLLNCTGSAQEIAVILFEADFALVSHGIEADPIFNYGNRKALQLWEISWEDFTSMPSRRSAQEVVQEERNRLLAETSIKGFSHFSGVRISSSGKLFRIEDGIIWNILDAENQYCGQAAIYSNYKFLD